MALSKRLAAVASAVRHGSLVADIGTDHAYLPVYLVQNGIAPAAIAADIAAGPAAAARRTVQTANLTDKIEVRLGDGLSPLAPEDAEDMIIAGMGGETIAAILSAADWIKHTRYQLVLQPMSRVEMLHAYLLTNGFHITREWTVEEDGHLYVVLTAVYTDTLPNHDPVAHIRGGFDAESGKAYFDQVCKTLSRRAAGVEHTDPATAATLREWIHRICEETT